MHSGGLKLTGRKTNRSYSPGIQLLFHRNDTEAIRWRAMRYKAAANLGGPWWGLIYEGSTLWAIKLNYSPLTEQLRHEYGVTRYDNGTSAWLNSELRCNFFFGFNFHPEFIIKTEGKRNWWLCIFFFFFWGASVYCSTEKSYKGIQNRRQCSIKGEGSALKVAWLTYWLERQAFDRGDLADLLKRGGDNSVTSAKCIWCDLRSHRWHDVIKRWSHCAAKLQTFLLNRTKLHQVVVCVTQRSLEGRFWRRRVNPLTDFLRD